ncbi:hypothetical protein [Sphaerothrix gracilis]|uniref:hypothetical protein n=1 Tax=Sphaerothrix gracilis TaxID=3151835 RepID=UPI0031FE3996
MVRSNPSSSGSSDRWSFFVGIGDRSPAVPEPSFAQSLTYKSCQRSLLRRVTSEIF